MYQKQTSGFTIVELLIVIVVIAILAAITIIGYNGIRDRAVDTSLQSDLRNAKSTILNSEITSGAFPSNTNGIQASNGATYQYTVDNNASPRTFCLTAQIGTKSYFIEEDTAPAVGVCPGHTGGVVANIAWSDQTSSGIEGWLNADLSGDGQIGVAVIGGNDYPRTTADGGVTWTERLSAGLATYNAAATTLDGSSLFIASTGVIRQSIDNGVSWTTLPNSPASVAWRQLEVSSTGTVMAGHSSTLVYMSTNSGASWITAPALPSGTPSDIALSDDGLTLYATNGSGGVYKTTNNGTSWTTLPNMAGISVDTNTDGSIVYTTTGTLRYSTDGGATSVSRPFPVTGVNNIKIAANNPNVLLVSTSATLGVIYSSQDGGTTWREETDLGSGFTWRRLVVSADGQNFLALRYSHFIIKGSL